MSEYATIEHYVNHIMGEITKGDVERVSEKLRALGWEEVVRCRDCAKWDFMHQDPDGTEWGECAEFSHSCGGHFTRMNGFCYWGERKNESLVEFIEREGRKRDTND